MYLIGIDMGGSKLAGGVLFDGELLFSESVPTGEPDAAAIADRTAALIGALMARAGIGEDKVAAVGIGVPGSADRERDTIEFANNLGMEGVPFLSLMKKRLPGLRFALENDANAAAYAEFRLGAGRGCRSMVMITLGTGIGAGIIIDGELFEGVNFAAGELGHTVIEPDGLPCSCGGRGCLEMYASTSALIARARESMEKNRSSALWRICGGEPGRLDGKLFFEAVRRGDGTAAEVLSAFTRYLSLGVLNVVNLLEPEVVVIGGGISREGELLLSPVRERLSREGYSRMSKKRPRLAAASLGNGAGIIGAALLAERRLRGENKESSD